jgi:hypothetical protein
MLMFQKLIHDLCWPCPHRDRDSHIEFKFFKSIILGEPIYLVKVFRLFRLKIFRLNEIFHV